jgi:hypothetical protein
VKKIISLIIWINILQASAFGYFLFKGSDHELEIIEKKGEKPGSTLLIFGGIHGDEPGGYFSSELLSKIKMKRGKLIIVPRVNFLAVMLNKREFYGDMNRKFTSKKYPNDPDSKVVGKLKDLMKEADVFINQHDAYGFHRDKYISKNYNPYRYGQSLIVDTASFYSNKFKKEVNLEALGRRIVSRANQQIKSEKHHFCFWNHNSVAKGTKFNEMQKSATYYALTTYSIPAFGLETSKDLPTLFHKVKYQLIVIKEILNEFGFEYDFPKIQVMDPVMYWLEFLKNGKNIIRVNSNTIIRLEKGDKLILNHIYSNYNSGFSLDLLENRTINDIDKTIIFTKKAGIIIRKNNYTIGKVYLKKYLKNSIREIQIDLNGEHKSIPNWGKIQISEDQYFSILGTLPKQKYPRIDVRGFSAGKNSRDDSRVKIEKKDLIKKYSFKREGKIFFVKIYNSGILSGGFQVEMIKEN